MQWKSKLSTLASIKKNCAHLRSWPRLIRGQLALYRASWPRLRRGQLRRCAQMAPAGPRFLALGPVQSEASIDPLQARDQLDGDTPTGGQPGLAKRIKEPRNSTFLPYYRAALTRSESTRLYEEKGQLAKGVDPSQSHYASGRITSTSGRRLQGRIRS